MFKDFLSTIDSAFKGMGSLSAEGIRLFKISLVIFIVCVALYLCIPAPAAVILPVLSFIFAVFVPFFFRDPQRIAEFAPDEIVCPADGRVMSVKAEKNDGVVVVRIFLSVFDVHIQRSTMPGDIGEITYTKGKFAIASAADAVNNERNLIRISGGGRFAHVEQITGAIARRISCWVKQGQKVKAGEKIGLIYFGSQVAVYLPQSARILVKPGQKVEGGLTVLGLWG